MWFLLLIPAIAIIIAARYVSHKITIGELFIPVAASALTILISSAIIKSKNIEDVEYNGYVIVMASYYEYWETYVERECSYTTTCCCDKDGNNCTTTTHYYDCSYCDDNPARYTVTLSNGWEITTTKKYYNYLMQRWNAVPVFVDMNRDINYYRSKCGKDGDRYNIHWNNVIETSESFVQEVTFTNYLKINHSAFDYPYMSDAEADSIGLFRYPEFHNQFKQRALLSKNFIFSERIHTKLEYLNGNLGPKYKVKVFTLIFKDKPIDIALKQEQYWQGGNQNELVVCISIDDAFNIQWVKCFSWCDNKRIVVDTREDISEQKILNLDGVYDIYNKNIPLYFKYKSFKDFNYLKFEPTKAQLVWIFVVVLIITALSIWFCIANEIDPATPEMRRHK